MADAQERERERRGVREHPERHPVLREVRALRERRLDAQHADDRRVRPVGRGGPSSSVDAPAALGLHGEPHDVGADRRVGCRPPGDRVRAARERDLAGPAHLAPVDPRADGVQAHARLALQVEEHPRDVPSLDARCDRHEQRPVAREPLRGAAHGQCGQPGGAISLREGCTREHTECGEPSDGGAQQPPSTERLEHSGIVVRPAAGRACATAPPRSLRYSEGGAEALTCGCREHARRRSRHAGCGRAQARGSARARAARHAAERRRVPRRRRRLRGASPVGGRLLALAGGRPGRPLPRRVADRVRDRARLGRADGARARADALRPAARGGATLVAVALVGGAVFDRLRGRLRPPGSPSSSRRRGTASGRRSSSRSSHPARLRGPTSPCTCSRCSRSSPSTRHR